MENFSLLGVVFLVCVAEVLVTAPFIILKIILPALNSGLLHVNGQDYTRAEQPLHYWSLVMLGFLMPVPFAVGAVVLAFYLPSKCGTLFPF